MKFDKKTAKWGEYLGFISAYLVFTTILWVILLLTKKFSGPYWLIALITAGITLLGILIKRVLK